MKNGTAISGSQGRFLEQLCKEIGINYNDTYRTLLFKARLDYNGKNKKKRQEALFSITKERDWYAILRNEISTIKPRYIVPFGELGFNYLTGEHGHYKFRGSILPLRKGVVGNLDSYRTRILPTFGPREIFVKYSNKVITQLDLGKLQRYLAEGEPSHQPKISIVRNVDQFRSFLDRHPKEIYPWGVFDIETKFNIPVCIGFCFSENEAVCVPLLDERISTGERVSLWKLVAGLLTERQWVNQNIKFDIGVLHKFFFRHIIFKGDTALRASVLYCELPKRLGFLNSIYTDMPYFKDEGKDAEDRDQLYTYCGKDCVSTHIIYNKQSQDLEDLGLTQFSSRVEGLFWHYVHMENHGLMIDQGRLLHLLAEYETLYYIHCGVLESLIGKPINPQSPKQIQDLIYGELKYPPQKDKETGNLTSDEETLENLYTFHESPNPLARTILELTIGCRKLHKVIEYCSTPIHPDGRMRCSYDLGGTKNGRTSGKVTTDYLLRKEGSTFVFSSIGHSLQTIGKHGFKIGGITYGKNLRSIFVPGGRNTVLVEGDYSQAEARVDAVLAKDFDFLHEFDRKPGVHCITAGWVYDCDPMLIKKGTEEYHVGKTARHAGERNMYPPRLVMMIQKDLEFCTKVLEKFHAAQPRIRDVFHRDVIDFVRANRFLTSPHGRRRDFFDRPDHHMFNEAISVLPQMIVSDHNKFSMPLMQEKAKEGKKGVFYQPCYEGHDALMSEMHKDNVEDYYWLYKNVAERPIDMRKGSLGRDYDLILPVEVSISEGSWQDMKEVKF